MSAPESLDTRGLLCPLPVIRTQEKIRDLAPGALLTVLATDAGTLQDIPAWCRVHGHELLAAETLDAPEPPGQSERAPRRPPGLGDGAQIYRFSIRVTAG